MAPRRVVAYDCWLVIRETPEEVVLVPAHRVFIMEIRLMRDLYSDFADAPGNNYDLSMATIGYPLRYPFLKNKSAEEVPGETFAIAPGAMQYYLATFNGTDFAWSQILHALYNEAFHIPTYGTDTEVFAALCYSSSVLWSQLLMHPADVLSAPTVTSCDEQMLKRTSPRKFRLGQTGASLLLGLIRKASFRNFEQMALLAAIIRMEDLYGRETMIYKQLEFRFQECCNSSPNTPTTWEIGSHKFEELASIVAIVLILLRQRPGGHSFAENFESWNVLTLEQWMTEVSEDARKLIAFLFCFLRWADDLPVAVHPRPYDFAIKLLKKSAVVYFNEESHQAPTYPYLKFGLDTLGIDYDPAGIETVEGFAFSSIGDQNRTSDMSSKETMIPYKWRFIIGTIRFVERRIQMGLFQLRLCIEDYILE